MKNHYTLFKLLLAVALTVNSMASKAQHTIEHLTANNVNAGFGIGGNLFTRIDSPATIIWGMMETPKGSGKLPMFTAALWMSGLDAATNVHCASQRYTQTGHDYFDGPISATYNTAYDKFYKRVFKVTRSQIVHHQSLGNVILPTQIDSAILFWPAKGNPYVAISFAVNIDSHLAPFVDVNNNGIYDPNHGDYPDVCGEEAIFFVFNDDRGSHFETNGEKLSIEIRGLAESFVDLVSTNPFEKRALNNTVFVSYEVENKSQDNYHDFYLAMFEDPDLGCFNNDRVGCDTNQNLMFVYNGSFPDPDCNAVNGYGQLHVANGTGFLNQPMTTFGYFVNGAAANTTDPTTCSQYRNNMMALWNDGTHFTVGGGGYGGTIPTNFLSPGDPNNPNDWGDGGGGGGVGLPAGDRRMQGSSGPISFAAGETKYFDYAFTTSYDTSGTNLTIIDTLKRDADIVQQFYNNSILSCRSTHQIPLGIGTVNNPTLQVHVYPNPANSVLFIETETNIDLAEVTDMLGRTVLSKTAEARKISLDVSALAHGMYLLRVKAGNQVAVKKIVLE